MSAGAPGIKGPVAGGCGKNGRYGGMVEGGWVHGGCGDVELFEVGVSAGAEEDD